MLQPEHALEFFPTEAMTFNQKLNAITRIVLILTAVSYLTTKKMNIIVVSVISVVCIYLMFYYHKENGEGFKNTDGNLVKLYNRDGPKVEFVPELDETFQKSAPNNPLSNVLISDYDYNPNRRPAEPSYTKEGKDNILEETKRSIQLLNPGQPGIDKKLFQDVTDNLELEQSMRQFYSTANTTIPNDQNDTNGGLNVCNNNTAYTRYYFCIHKIAGQTGGIVSGTTEYDWKGPRINYIHPFIREEIYTTYMQSFAFDVGSNFNTGIFGFNICNFYTYGIY